MYVTRTESTMFKMLCCITLVIGFLLVFHYICVIVVMGMLKQAAISSITDQIGRKSNLAEDFSMS